MNSWLWQIVVINLLGWYVIYPNREAISGWLVTRPYFGLKGEFGDLPVWIISGDRSEARSLPPYTPVGVLSASALPSLVREAQEVKDLSQRCESVGLPLSPVGRDGFWCEAAWIAGQETLGRWFCPASAPEPVCKAACYAEVVVGNHPGNLVEQEFTFSMLRGLGYDPFQRPKCNECIRAYATLGETCEGLSWRAWKAERLIAYRRALRATPKRLLLIADWVVGVFGLVVGALMLITGGRESRAWVRSVRFKSRVDSSEWNTLYGAVVRRLQETIEGAEEMTEGELTRAGGFAIHPIALGLRYEGGNPLVGMAEATLTNNRMVIPALAVDIEWTPGQLDHAASSIRANWTQQLPENARPQAGVEATLAYVLTERYLRQLGEETRDRVQFKRWDSFLGSGTLVRALESYCSSDVSTATVESAAMWAYGHRVATTYRGKKEALYEYLRQVLSNRFAPYCRSPHLTTLAAEVARVVAEEATVSPFSSG